MVIPVTKPEHGFGMSVHASKKKTGFKVDRLLPGSYAESLGISVGDMVLAINNHPIASWQPERVLAELRYGQSLTLL